MIFVENSWYRVKNDTGLHVMCRASAVYHNTAPLPADVLAAAQPVQAPDMEEHIWDPSA